MRTLGRTVTVTTMVMAAAVEEAKGARMHHQTHSSPLEIQPCLLEIELSQMLVLLLLLLLALGLLLLLLLLLLTLAVLTLRARVQTSTPRCRVSSSHRSCKFLGSVSFAPRTRRTSNQLRCRLHHRMQWLAARMQTASTLPMGSR